MCWFFLACYDTNDSSNISQTIVNASRVFIVFCKPILAMLLQTRHLIFFVTTLQTWVYKTQQRHARCIDDRLMFFCNNIARMGLQNTTNMTPSYTREMHDARLMFLCNNNASTGLQNTAT